MGANLKNSVSKTKLGGQVFALCYKTLVRATEYYAASQILLAGRPFDTPVLESYFYWRNLVNIFRKIFQQCSYGEYFLKK